MQIMKCLIVRNGVACRDTQLWVGDGRGECYSNGQVPFITTTD